METQHEMHMNVVEEDRTPHDRDGEDEEDMIGSENGAEMIGTNGMKGVESTPRREYAELAPTGPPEPPEVWVVHSAYRTSLSQSLSPGLIRTGAISPSTRS